MGYDKKQRIVLTVEHNGYSYSKVIFPQRNANYGYETIEQEMEWLYNRTM